MTRVTLQGGTCPNCSKKFKAAPPPDMPKGSPFGENLRALILYLRFTQNIALERLSTLLSTMLGLEISEGAIVNILAVRARRLRHAARGDPRKAAFGNDPAIGRDRPARLQGQLVFVGVPP